MSGLNIYMELADYGLLRDYAAASLGRTRQERRWKCRWRCKLKRFDIFMFQIMYMQKPDRGGVLVKQHSFIILVPANAIAKTKDTNQQKKERGDFDKGVNAR